MEKGGSIAYIYSPSYVKCCDEGFKVRRRASATHSLIKGYNLLTSMEIINPVPATASELLLFHSQEYIEYLQSVNGLDDLEKEEDISVAFGLGYDCPLMKNQFDFVSAIAGATLTAANCLVNGKHNVAINWGGGWHHGKKDEASGFCYCNDIVLGIIKLREKFDRVLYIDLDLHHGDGVEDAFAYSSKVLTLSFHKHETGFFPGTGSVEDIGCGKSKGYAINFPFKNGIQDEQYVSVVKRVIDMVVDKFSPHVIVCQCGADGLSEDPMASFNLTSSGLGRSVQKILSLKRPTLFLGGGGYHVANTARCWTHLTSLITGRSLAEDIPENDHFEFFGPSFELSITPSNRANLNSKEYIEHTIQTVADNLKFIQV